MNKNLFSKCALFFFVTLILPFFANAQTDIYIRGAARLIPIALPQLCLQGDSSANRDIPSIISRDLELSGYFEVLNPASYIETPGKCGPQEATVYSDWSVLRTDGLVKGVVRGSGSSITVQLYLHEVGKQAVVMGKEYSGTTADIPRIAHKFANELMRYYTGEYGPWGTKVSFSTKVGRFKELAVMDIDGSNIRQLTNEKSLSVSSSWAPNGNQLVYTSYRTRIPDLFTIDIGSRKISQITSNTNLELGAKYLADGETIIFSSSDGSNSFIGLTNKKGQIIKKLTNSNGIIDVSPSLSPTGDQIAFCSNRAGGPQVYTMGIDGSNVRRISFVTSNYCTSPAWSKKGNKIAFVCRADAGFQLFVVNSDGSSPMQLTSYGDNEDPSWSPDGRYLVFASTLGKSRVFNLALIRADGSNIKQLTVGRGGDTMPSWGPQFD